MAADGIRVNSVAPRHDLDRLPHRPQRPAEIAEIPMGRAGQPQEIAGAVARLLSDETSYATGTVTRDAGGM